MKKILVADDDEIVRKTVQRSLKDKPFELVFAVNGEEAVEKAGLEKPDLILLDIQMPRKDGREAIQDIRHNPETKSIPVIMLTGLGQTMDKLAGFELGANDYITKPFDTDVLVKRIQTAIQKRGG